MSVKKKYINKNGSAQFTETFVTNCECRDSWQKRPWRNTRPQNQNAGKQSVSGEKQNFKITMTSTNKAFVILTMCYSEQDSNAVSEIIGKNINSTRTLFAMIDKLTNPPNQIAPELLSTDKWTFFLF